MKESLSISLIVPAFNAAAFINETLDCVNGQHRPPDEIVVVDDGSSDSTVSLVKEWAIENRPNLKLIEQRNQGASAARNTAIRNARCEFVATVDADDAVLPNHLETLESGFQVRPDLVLCFGDCAAYDPSDSMNSMLAGSKLIEMPYEEQKNGLRVIKGSAYLGIVAGQRIPTSATMFRRDMALQIGLFDPTQRQSNDTDFLLRLSRTGAFGYFPTVLERLRRHETNMTHKRGRVETCKWRIRALEKMLEGAEQFDLTDHELKMTNVGLRKRVRHLLYEASLRGWVTYFNAVHYCFVRGYLAPLSHPKELARALRWPHGQPDVPKPEARPKTQSSDGPGMNDRIIGANREAEPRP